MWNEYVREKLLEIESDRRRRMERIRAQLPAIRAQRGPLAPAALVTGRSLRRLGEAIESWAAPHLDLHRAPGADSSG